MIKIHSTGNIVDPVAIAVQIPTSFLTNQPPNSKLELFAEFIQSGGNDEEISTFEPLGATFDQTLGIAYATIPQTAFTPVASVVTYVAIGYWQDSSPTKITATSFSPVGHYAAWPNEIIQLTGNLTFEIPPLVTSPLGSPLTNPLTVTDVFGQRTHPKTGQLRPHNGVDLRANGEPVYPVLAGIVAKTLPEEVGGKSLCTKWETQSGPTPGPNVCKQWCGHGVKIDHGNGLTSVYCHLEPNGIPPVGTPVITGLPIGVADTSGGVTGPHLHLGLKWNGVPVDPMLFIDGQNPNRLNDYLSTLSVVAEVDGKPVEATRRPVTSANFDYSANLDIAPLGLIVGSASDLSIKVQWKDWLTNVVIPPEHKVHTATIRIPSSTVITHDYCWGADGRTRTQRYSPPPYDTEYVCLANFWTPPPDNARQDTVSLRAGGHMEGEYFIWDGFSYTIDNGDGTWGHVTRTKTLNLSSGGNFTANGVTILSDSVINITSGGRIYNPLQDKSAAIINVKSHNCSSSVIEADLSCIALSAHPITVNATADGNINLVINNIGPAPVHVKATTQGCVDVTNPTTAYGGSTTGSDGPECVRRVNPPPIVITVTDIF